MKDVFKSIDDNLNFKFTLLGQLITQFRKEGVKIVDMEMADFSNLKFKIEVPKESYAYPSPEDAAKAFKEKIYSMLNMPINGYNLGYNVKVLYKTTDRIVKEDTVSQLELDLYNSWYNSMVIASRKI